ncbi:hypothetical protein Poli38472_000422 [Pythium oligandrum]|uniref:3'-5' exonuclease domain-containing protein n=1 Tax=Pythium oligandrum TaxID=41045 RepID=A0A8K1CCN9_PYTOL|nr:hypothetical protein Poli38472_000422 [Pythium oligandrum]|eukprot:TMW60380.1 hypothetical protein Poli38472_000422 [Pythium oligandrum]
MHEARAMFRQNAGHVLVMDTTVSLIIYVKHYPEHQRDWITALLRGRTADKLTKKRIALFKLDEAEFPDYVESEVSTALLRAQRKLRNALTKTQGDAALRLYVTRFLIERKGPFDPITRLFVHRADLASQFPHVDAFLSVSALIGDENIVFMDFREGLDVVASELAQADFVGFDFVRCLVDMQALTKKIDNHNARLLEATQQLESTNNAEDTKEDGEVVGNEAKEGEQEETVVVVESARKKQKSWRKDRKQQRPTDASQTVSLATLAEQYLGKPLDKRSRLSDWERRPLTRAQLHYAALDAYALVAIYKKMQEQVSSEVFERFVRQLTKKEQGRQRAADAAASAIITSETMR